MALTLVTIQKRQQVGSSKERLVKITGPTSYVTGGEAIALSRFGLGRVDSFVFSHTDAATGKSVVWDPTNKKVKCLQASGSEESSTTDLSAVNYWVLVRGK